MLRFRLFKLEEGGLRYARTDYVPAETPLKAFLEARAAETQPGDGLYFLDTFYRRRENGTWQQLPAGHPDVQGLYTQAVRTESEAARD